MTSNMRFKQTIPEQDEQNKIDFKIESYLDAEVMDGVGDVNFMTWRNMENLGDRKYIMGHVTYKGKTSLKRINIFREEKDTLPFTVYGKKFVVIRPLVKFFDIPPEAGNGRYPVDEPDHLYRLTKDEEIEYLQLMNEIKGEIIEELREGYLKFKQGFTKVEPEDTKEEAPLPKHMKTWIKAQFQNVEKRELSPVQHKEFMEFLFKHKSNDCILECFMEYLQDVDHPMLET